MWVILEVTLVNTQSDIAKLAITVITLQLQEKQLHVQDMDKKILRGNRTKSSEFKSQLEKTLEDRLTLMDIDTNLKVSFLGGLAEVKMLKER